MSLTKKTNVKVYFGNNNTFSINLPYDAKLGFLVVIFANIIGCKSAEIRYIVCNGHILGSTEKYGFSKPLNSITILDNRAVMYIITSREAKYPLDRIVISKFNEFLKSSIPVKNQINIGNYAQNLQLSDIPIVLTEDSFNQLIDVTTVDTDLQEEDNDDFTCFCGETEGEITRSRAWLPCAHSFHTRCIKIHLTQTSVKCPICSMDVRGGSN
jgi:hypothetical protein